MSFKHDAPSPERPSLSLHPLVIAVAFVAACSLVAVAFVGVQSYLRRTSPVSVLTGYFIPKPQAYFGKDRIAILLLGIDYNYDEKDQEYSAGARSDTIMALALNVPTDAHPKPSVDVLSVLRDTDVVLPNGHEDKINAAYSDGGPKYSEKTVAQFLGLPGFDRYIALRVNATKDLIDAIGGIDVVPDETMNYDDNWGHLHIHFIGGKKYHMNGDQAVSYSRFRHDECSDPCRVKRQQQVIKIVVAKLRNERFNDLLHIRQLIAVANHNILTDLKPDEELSLASAFSSLDLHDVQTDQVPFTADKDLPCCGDVLIADDTAKEKLVKKYFLAPLPGATPVAVAATAVPVDKTAVAAIAPSSISVEVLNGSGTPGLGKRIAAALRAKGFSIAHVANADSFGYDATQIRVHSAAQPLAGERVRQALAPLVAASVAPGAASPKAASSDVTVIVGKDYGTPQSEASATK